MIRIIITALISTLITSAAAYGLHSFDVNRLKASQVKELAAKETALTNKCEAEKAITKKVSHDYQKNVADLNSRLADARRLHNGSCLSVKASGTGGRYVVAAPDQPVGQGVGRDRTISITRFMDLIGEGEQYRLQVLALQAFITAEKNAGAVR